MESLTPTQYQAAFEAYGEEHGYAARTQALPRLSRAIYNNPAACEKLIGAATQEAEQLTGASASEAHIVEGAVEEGVVVIIVNFPQEALDGLDREALAAGGIEIRRLSAIDPSHSAGMLRARTKAGAFSTGFNEDRLTFYRSFSEQEMDELGVEIPFDPAEAPDLEPEEQ